MLIDQLDELRRELKGCKDVFIVEGIRDKKVLIKLGFINVVDISGKSLYDFVEEIRGSFKSAVILSDFDEEGERKALALSALLKKANIKVNPFLRKRIKNLFKIQKIEELNSFTKMLEDDYYGENCSIYDKILNRSRVLSRRNNRKARCYRRNIRPDRRAVRF